jgi:hypothetical protein
MALAPSVLQKRLVALQGQLETLETLRDGRRMLSVGIMPTCACCGPVAAASTNDALVLKLGCSHQIPPPLVLENDGEPDPLEALGLVS